VAITTEFEPYYDEKQFDKVDADIAQRETEYDQTYGNMINDTDKYYDAQIQASKDWADKQSQLQQENTDFAIEKIEQEKDKAHKDYLKEQSGAYVDWQKQSNEYGVNAEKMASAGLGNTGFSESSQVSMYNTYQNRVATARESYNNAVLNYNNAIKDAQLQNNAALAEIAYQSLQQQLELSLQGFQYKNQLVIDLADKKAELDNIKWNRYQDILQQMNAENALKLEIEKHNDTQKWETEQNALDRQHQLERDRINNEFAEKLEGIKHDYNIKYLNAKTEKDKEVAQEEHRLKMLQLAQEQRDALARIDEDYKKKLEYEKSLYNYKKESTVVSGASSSSTKKTSTDTKVWTIAKQSNNSGRLMVDTNSVINLGYGPISSEKLAQLVSSGVVEEYVEGNKIKFRKVPSKHSITNSYGTFVKLK
jgi:hypothetical protein